MTAAVGLADVRQEVSLRTIAAAVVLARVDSPFTTSRGNKQDAVCRESRVES